MKSIAFSRTVAKRSNLEVSQAWPRKGIACNLEGTVLLLSNQKHLASPNVMD